MKQENVILVYANDLSPCMTIAILCHAVVKKGVCQITDSELDQHSEGFTTAIKYNKW